MRQAPINYFVTVAIGALLWVVAGIFVGKMLGDSVVLQSYTTDSFLSTYRITTASVSFLAVLLCLWWYAYGARKEVASRLKDAGRRWVVLFASQVVLSAIGLAVLAFSFRTEGLSAGDYVIVFGMLALDTFIFFWGCTFFMSPPVVEFIPWGKH